MSPGEYVFAICLIAVTLLVVVLLFLAGQHNEEDDI